jgi:hypothetical protein
MRDRGFLKARAARAEQGAMARILEKAGTDEAIPGDELPGE